MVVCALSMRSHAGPAEQLQRVQQQIRAHPGVHSLSQTF